MSNSHELVYDTLEANKAHQSALIKYAQALAAEIQELDNFLNTIAVSDASEDNTEQRSTVQIKGASKPTSVIQPSTFLKPDSPFYIEGSRLARYTSYTEPRQMKGKELDALADAVKREGQRLQTLNHPMLLSEQEIQNDELNWTTIAERVSAASGNTRTADECRVKWEAGLLNNGKTTQDGASRPRHIWSVQFDKRLKDAVDRYGFYNWTMVARSVSEDATASQCEGRFSRALDSSIKRGPWVAEEDARLRTAVEVYGHSWTNVALIIPGRTNDQCRERWLDQQRARKVEKTTRRQSTL